MNLAGKIAVGVISTLTVAAVAVGTEVMTNALTDTMNPQNLYTYLSFQSFSKDFDNRNQESFLIVSDFVNSYGVMNLVAESHKLLLQDGFVYTYRHKSVDTEKDPSKLTNWDAVRKYMQIEKESKRAKRDGKTYNVSNA